MKRTVPLLITAIVGFVLVCSAFVPIAETWGEKALIWFDLLAGIAFILGGANLCGSQLKKISTRRKGWGYAAVTLVAFLITLDGRPLKDGRQAGPQSGVLRGVVRVAVRRPASANHLRRRDSRRRPRKTASRVRPQAGHTDGHRPSRSPAG